MIGPEVWPLFSARKESAAEDARAVSVCGNRVYDLGLGMSNAAAIRRTGETVSSSPTGLSRPPAPSF